MFEDDQEAWILRGLLSLPFDLGFDVAFCPIDLIAWAAGRDKGRSRRSAAGDGADEDAAAVPDPASR